MVFQKPIFRSRKLDNYNSYKSGSPFPTFFSQDDNIKLEGPISKT